MSHHSAPTPARFKGSPVLVWMRQRLRVPVTALLLASSAFWTQQVRGATLTWSHTGTNPLGSDGGGTWNASNTNWGNSTTNVVWNNATPDDAIFGKGGAGGTVLLGANTTAKSLTFNSLSSGNYIIGPNAAETLTVNTGGILANESATINANMILSGAQTWTAVAGKTLTIGSSAITNGANLLTVFGAGNTNINGALGSGAGGLTMSGSGALTLGGTNTFTGATILNGGTLNLNYGTNNTTKLADGNTLTIGRAAITLTGGSHTEVVSATTLAAGASSITRPSGTSVLRLNAITRTAGSGGTVDFGVASVADTDTINTNGILGGWATVGGADWAVSGVTAADTPITALAGGSYIVNNWAAGNNTNVTSSNAPTSGATTNSLRFGTAVAATVTLAGTNTISSGGILVAPAVGNNASIITGGNLQGPVSGDLIINQNNTSNSLTISSIIINNTATSVTKSGAGTLILNAANTYTGTTFLNAGTLQVGNVTGLGAVAAPLQINGGTLQLATDASVSPYPTTINRNAQINAGRATAGAGITNTLGTLNINFGSTLTVSPGVNVNANTVYGVSFGNVTVANTATTNSVAGAPTFTVNNNGTAIGTLTFAGTFNNGGYTPIFNGAGNVTATGVISGAGGLSMNGTGTLSLNGGNTFTGVTTLTNGAIVLGNASGLGASASASLIQSSGTTLNLNNLSPTIANLNGSGVINSGVAGSPILTINNATDNAYAGTIVNGTGTAVGFTKGAAGTMVLTGANTYSGATTVTGGVLRLQAGGTAALSDSTPIVPVGGVFEYAGAAGAASAETVGALTLNSSTTGAGRVQSTFGTSTSTTLTFSSITARNVGATVTFAYNGGTSTTNKIVINGQAQGLVGSGGAYIGTDFAYYDTTLGAVRAPVYGTDVGTSAVNALTAGTMAQINAAASGLGDTTLTTLSISGANNMTFNPGAILTLTQGGILKTGGGASIISGGGGIRPLTSDLAIRTDAAGDSITLSMPVLPTTANPSLTKAGLGSLTLTQPGAVVGTVRISAGSLAITDNGALRDALLDMNGVDSGTFSFNGAAPLNLGAITGSRGTLAVGANTLTLGNYGATGSNYNGLITGTAGLIKTGPGTQGLGGANTGLTGTITIDSGTLQSRSANGLGANANPININTGATLGFVTSGATTFGYTAITPRGNSTFSMDTGGDTVETLSGNLVLNNFTLNLANANNSDLTLGGTLTLNGLASAINNLNSSATLVATFAGALGGTGALNRLGSGNAAFTAVNTFTGGANFFGGFNQISGSGTINSSAVFVAPGAQLRIGAASNIPTAGLIVSSSIIAGTGNAGLSNIAQGPTGAQVTTVGAGLGVFEIPDYSIGSTLNAIKSGPSGAALRIFANQATNAIDMAAIGSHAAGNSPWFFGSRGAFTYGAASMAADGGIYRIGANDSATNALTFSTAALSGPTNSVIIGMPQNRAVSITGATGTVIYGVAETYGGSTAINRGSTLSVTSTAAGVQNLIPSASALSVFGQLAYSGAYASTGAVQQTFTTTPNIVNTTFGMAAGQSVGLVLNNNAYTASNIAARLASTTNVNLSSGNFRYLGPTGAFTSSQALNTVTFEGSDLIEISRGNATANNAAVTIANLVRANNGAMTIVTTGGAFNAATGSDTKLVTTQINGATPVVTNGMIAPWIIDQTTAASPTFVTSGATGLGPVTYDVGASTAALFNAATASQKVDVTTTIAPNSTSVHALRVGNLAITGTNTITVGANASASDGAGVIFGSTAAQTHTPNWVFGTGGNREAVIYASTATFATTLSGTVNATGLTKSGPGNLTLTGTNTGTGTTSLLSGTATVNMGSLIIANPAQIGTRVNPTNPYAVDAMALRLAGGTFDASGSAVGTGNYLNNITVVNDSAINNSTTPTLPRFGGLTIAARQGGAVDPTMLTITGGTVFTGATNLQQNTWFNLPTATTGVNATFLEGQVSGAFAIEKFGVGNLNMLSSTNSYSGGTTINNGNVVSFTGTGTPFGSGSVTVKPGAGVRLASASNVVGAITLNSDTTGMAILSVGYVGALPAFATTSANTGGPFSAVIGIDASGYGLAVDQSSIGNGTTFLGSMMGVNAATGVAQPNSANFTGTLTPGASLAVASGMATAPSGSTYRIGGGGGALNVNGVNMLTGANNVVFGAISNSTQANSLGLLGGGGTTFVNGSNNYTGFTTFNQAQTVIAGSDTSFGTSTLLFNGGILSSDGTQRANGFVNGRVISNAVKFSGDITINNAFNGSAADVTLTGPIGLSNSTVGGSMRTITVPTVGQNQSNGGVVTITNVISDGDSSYNGLVKAGGGLLRLTSANTYTGITQLNGGFVAISADNNLGTNPYVNLNGGGISAWATNITIGKTLNFQGASNLEVSEGYTMTQGSGTTWQGAGALQKMGSGTLVLTGDNSFTGLTIAGGVVNVNNNAQLGNQITPGIINFANNIANNNTTSGIPMLRFLDSMTVNRVLTSTTAGAVNVDAGKIVSVTLSPSGTAALHKVGLGTLDLAVNDTVASAFNINAGVLRVANFTGASTPFGTNGNPVLNGGTLQVLANTGDLAVTLGSGTLTINGGGTLALNQTGAFNSQITIGNITRTNQGTMVISPTTNMGGTSGQRSRVLVTGNILGVAAASANFNGILSPTIVRQTNGAANADVDFVTYTGATDGIGTGASTAFSGGINPAQVGTTTGNVLTGTNGVYALKTTGNISGGTLQIVANGTLNNQVQLGGLLINGAGSAAPQISSDLFFDERLR